MENPKSVDLLLESNGFEPSTIDQKEIEHFSEQANLWWDYAGPFSGLHTMNKLRVPFIQDCLIDAGRISKDVILLEKPLEGIVVLEVGCGGGILTEALAQKGCVITGIDVCDDLINIAKHHADADSSLSNLTYITTSIEEYSEKFPEKYDVVVCSEVIEHVTQQQKLVDSCVKSLKPGGSIFITTFSKTLAAWWMGIIMGEYILRYLPRGTHEWSKFISPKEVTKMLNKRDCDTKTVRGMKFEWYPVPRTWYWSSNTSVNYALHAVKKS